MPVPLVFFIVDDDEASVEIHSRLLREAGHEVIVMRSAKDALEAIQLDAPDCVLCDLSMPDMDGIDIFKKIRSLPGIKQPGFIIITGKHFEYDKRRAIKAGVDGYITKPINPETLLQDIFAVIHGTMTIEFWGVRGTLPVPGTKTIRYGGNTNCVTLKFARRCLLVFDAGTGIKELSNYLMKKNHPISAKILITHPHYDHINGLPFFAPLYVKGNEFEILGTDHGDTSLETWITDQMDSIYFPVGIKELASKISFRSLSEKAYHFDELKVESMLLNHPGRCLGFRVQFKDKSFCYITDNELYLKDSPFYNQSDVDRLINFIKDADVVVMDSTYTDKEYERKVGWGHSSVGRVVEVADLAKVKLLCLYHHDPDQFDNEIDSKLAEARKLLKERGSETTCIAPQEGEKITI